MCFDPIVLRIHVSCNVIFFDHQYLYPLPAFHSNNSTHSLLPAFEDMSYEPYSHSLAPITRFQPHLVYTRRYMDNVQHSDLVLELSHQEVPETSLLLSPPMSFLPPALASDPSPLKKSTRSSHPRKYDYSPKIFGYHKSIIATLSSIKIPGSYLEAIQHKCWQQEIQDERDALYHNQTWDIVTCPSDVFSIKLISDESLYRCKARLVALDN
ncbi:Retrovirus-related Pol polyprotein from transposon TNT 1-94 [Gossypium australe]|uniref:Retrovirus-related Pol polyprotein from transposon TNT 1-94 n=1 Tax=Gossypium australe TaxID=47621 RepID=A0A5B6VBG8_9ROSI|nr:Retrovirus-related Pol polyprotein from transposon TNT 1-94 [Gossypium australe]